MTTDPTLVIVAVLLTWFVMYTRGKAITGRALLFAQFLYRAVIFLSWYIPVLLLLLVFHAWVAVRDWWKSGR